MPTIIQTSAIGTSPPFTITDEEFKLSYFTTITPISIDGVPPPTLGPNGGYSQAMNLVNKWFPWIDEKLVEPKWDGVCQWLGMMSNQPSYIKDYYFITMMRATDYILAPNYVGLLIATVSGPTPKAPDYSQG